MTMRRTLSSIEKRIPLSAVLCGALGIVLSSCAAPRGIAVLDGQMIEELHAAAARRVLALHAAIAADTKE